MTFQSVWHSNNNLRHKSNHKSNRLGLPKIEQKGAGEGLAERKGDVTKVYYLSGRMRKNLIYHDTLSTKSDLQNNPKICATICATSLTAYWWVPGMFFGDKRVIGLQKSNKGRRWTLGRPKVTSKTTQKSEEQAEAQA